MSARPRNNLTCQICHRALHAGEVLPADIVRQSVIETIRAARPDWNPAGYICWADLHRFRSEHIRKLLLQDKGELSDLDREVMRTIQEHETLATLTSAEMERRPSFGERLADRVATFGGSWLFISLFAAVILLWMVVNVVVLAQRPFDPYPFILLNLVLSCLAAVQAPIIMMSQNRVEAKDRLRAEYDYKVNLKAELEVRLLNEKMDRLLSHQWQRLLEIQEIQLDVLQELAQLRSHRA